MRAREQEGLFLEWLGDHKRLMLKVVRAYAASLEDQNDLFQEVLLQVWRSIPGFAAKSKVSTWIYKVSLNTALAWKRSEIKHRSRRGHVMMLDEFPDLREGAAESTQHRETVERLYEEIRRLPGLDGPLALLYLDGLSYREMAEILGISESNVGVKLNRIKKQLRKTLKGQTDGA